MDTAMAEMRRQVGRRASRASFAEQSRSNKSSRHPSGASTSVDRVEAASAATSELQLANNDSEEASDQPGQLPDMAQILDAARWKLKWTETSEELVQAKSVLLL